MLCIIEGRPFFKKEAPQRTPIIQSAVRSRSDVTINIMPGFGYSFSKMPDVLLSISMLSNGISIRLLIVYFLRGQFMCYWT